MIGDGVLVDLAGSSLFGAYAAGEVAEVVDGEGDVGVEGFADGLAVVEGFALGEEFEVLFHAIGDAEEDGGSLGGGDGGPGVLGGVGGVEG